MLPAPSQSCWTTPETLASKWPSCRALAALAGPDHPDSWLVWLGWLVGLVGLDCLVGLVGWFDVFSSLVIFAQYAKNVKRTYDKLPKYQIASFDYDTCRLFVGQSFAQVSTNMNPGFCISAAFIQFNDVSPRMVIPFLKAL
jgi:hypothetical protein